MNRVRYLLNFVVLLASLPVAHAANPNKLWEIVSQSCLPAFAAGHGAGQCRLVSSEGYALLKDKVGPAQYILIPTIPVSGIESPAVLQPGLLNYWRAAWDNRDWVGATLGRPLRDDEIGLAINSANSRTQQQLHIHIDCLDPKVATVLATQSTTEPGRWNDLTLKGHRYAVTRVAASSATSVNPFDLVLRRTVYQHQEMKDHTILMTATTGGFLIVDGHYQPDGPDTNPGAAEELQDHSCRIASPLS
ncbi:CDP-diacylglycerol diphosphatase [Crenobacter sp. SG2303]|uniref:CDP-diacylglycerol pyrophosphatase n=1 Tax=Crenobacter oryzisoli TaxID=3056844 RepID=A0ABT7XK17_9NEIS|nr:CDP-diacylglycerol diphosphatase [Crenobacter sp. SG2303]MDN0074134.1 CDP-diacylglycerol diphosphatase [Crenobacter sp. SG2303]